MAIGKTRVDLLKLKSLIRKEIRFPGHGNSRIQSVSKCRPQLPLTKEVMHEHFNSSVRLKAWVRFLKLPGVLEIDRNQLLRLLMAFSKLR